MKILQQINPPITENNPTITEANPTETYKDKDKDKDNDNDKEIYITLPACEGELAVSEQMLEEYVKAYPSVDVPSELQKAKTWLLSNPTKQRTKLETSSFVYSWLNREALHPRAKPKPPQRQKSFLEVAEDIINDTE